MIANIAQTLSGLFLSKRMRRSGPITLLFILVAAAGATPDATDAPVGPDAIEAVMDLASKAQYEAAVALYERIREQRPDTIEAIHGHKVAVVYAVIGDRSRHEAHCRWLMDRYRDAELPTDAERSVKGYLLFPSAEDPALLARALERTRLATDYAVERGEGQYLLWFEGSRGMAEYRSGNYAEAIAYLKKAADAESLYISSLALPFQALAEFAQGNRDRADALLKQARAAAARLPAPGTEEYLKEWTDTLTTQLALREAEKVIAGSQPEAR